MAFAGTFKDFPLTDVLQLIGLQRKTGVLALDGPDDAVEIFVQDGAVVWARSRRDPLDARMRRVFRLRGLVTAEQMTDAERLQAETGQRLGSALIQRAGLPREEWQRAVSLEVEEVLFRIFRWREGAYRFEAREPLDLPEGRIEPVAVETLLMEGIRQIDEWPLIAQAVPRREGIPYRSEPGAAIDLSRLGPNEAAVLDLVDGQRPAADVVDASGLGEFETWRALASLVEAGVIGLAAERAGADASVQGGERLGRRGIPAKALWASAAGWVALNLILFRPWATFLPPLRQVDVPRQIQARADLSTLAVHLDQYFAETGSFPPGLNALVRRGMVDEALLRDPWGRPYRYEATKERYRLCSAAPAGPQDPASPLACAGNP